MPDDERRLSVLANAIGFEMLRHDGRDVYAGDDGVERIDVSDDEAQRCRDAAVRALEHLATYDSAEHG